MRLYEFEVTEPVPELHDTIAISMLRPWIDVGRVGTRVLTRLERHMKAKELGRLAKPGSYFDFTRYRPRTRIIDGKRTLTLPNTIVHYAHDDDTDKDYLFLHVREPHTNGEDYTDAIAALLKHFNVNEHCRIGGMYDSVPHTRPLLVTGSLNDDYAQRAEGLVSVRRSTYQGPTSIVNLVSQSPDEAEVESTSLMAHLPQYVQLDEDHMGAFRLMEVLCAMYGFPRSLANSDRGVKQYQEIGTAVRQNTEVSNLVQQLETHYDQDLSSSSQTEEEEDDEDISLAPHVESFLEEMGQRLADEGEQEEDDDDGGE